MHSEGEPRVLVAGAGIGWLCLTNGLKRAGIPVTVFERDATAYSRMQGHRISFGVNRLTLREILLAGLGDSVVFGKRLTGIQSIKDGGVAARFSDGGEAVGDVLVGAARPGSWPAGTRRWRRSSTRQRFRRRSLSPSVRPGRYAGGGPAP